MPEPGWYPDPRSDDQFRLWDGDGWTEQTRRRAAGSTLVAHEVAAPARVVIRPPHTPESTPSAGPPRRRRRWLVPALLVAAVLAVIGAAVALRPTSGASATRTAAASTVSASASSKVDCAYANRRPGPVRVIDWFAQHGLSAEIGGASPALPAGACRASSFRDGSVSGNVVIAYPSTDAASAARDASSIVAGNYRVVLQSSRSRSRYEELLRSLVAQTSGTTKS